MIRGGFLLPGQRSELKARLRDGGAEQRLARRANAMLLLDDGWSCERTAETLYLDETRSGAGASSGGPKDGAAGGGYPACKPLFSLNPARRNGGICALTP